MRAVFGLVLIVGMGLAGAAVYMIQGYIAQTEALVFVFNKQLSYGDALTPEDVQVIYWPEQALPATIFRDQAELFPENAPGPRYVMRDTEAFEPVLATRVTAPGELAGLTAKLEAGMRAFQIRVGAASGVSTFVQPDDFIDIYWTGGISGVDGNVTRLIESSMQIIAVDNSFTSGQSDTATEATTVTVAASPEQVARLAQAQSTGQLSMSLVGDGTETVTERIEVDTNAMLGIEEKEEVVAPVPEAERVCTVATRRGAEIIQTIIPCTD